jgi:4-amino-4-deoxy-L-arabinose transferase-like glycosyltransferase
VNLNKKQWIIIFLILPLLALPVFTNLDQLTVRLYDESRVAVNACEMKMQGNVIVTTFEQQPDLWNTKPPLLVWLQVFSMNIVGVNEWGIRLPSAIAGYLTALLLLLFAIRYLREFWLGIFTSLVLVSSLGFIGVHGARTGDYDTLLTFFITLYCLCFFRFLESEKVKYVYFTFIFIGLAVMTKGIGGLMMTPALLLYAIAYKKLIPLLKNKHIYIGLMIMLILSIWYYLVREMMNPGFLRAVFQNELGGRYFGVIEDHGEDFWYYFVQLKDYRYKEWMLFLLPAAILGIFGHQGKIRKVTLFSTICILLYFLVISFSRTKLFWYDLPLYPFMALIIGGGIYICVSWVARMLARRSVRLSQIIAIIVAIMIFYEPYRIVTKKSIDAREDNWDEGQYEITYFLRDALDGKHDLKNTVFVQAEYMSSNLFYVYMLNENGMDIMYTSPSNMQIENKKVVAYEPKVKAIIEEGYEYSLSECSGKICVFDVKNKKW